MIPSYFDALYGGARRFDRHVAHLSSVSEAGTVAMLRRWVAALLRSCVAVLLRRCVAVLRCWCVAVLLRSCVGVFLC